MLCDSVVRDAISGKATVVGVLQQFDVEAFPANTPPFSVWLQVTDGNGRLTLKLVVQHVPPESPDCETIVEISFSLNFDDPNVLREHVSQFETGITLEREGRYRITLTANGTTIQQRDFVATAR